MTTVGDDILIPGQEVHGIYKICEDSGPETETTTRLVDTRLMTLVVTVFLRTRDLGHDDTNGRTGTLSESWFS